MTVHESPFLHGIKVVELAGLAPVPFCGLLLADFGADVTVVINKSSKIASFEQRLSRGKKKMWLDFYCPEDLGKLRKLCQNADILLDPYRPGTLEHFGIEPARLIMENPGLIIARITGYGQTGPMAAKAGHDINYVALSGLLPTISGSRPGPPWPPANLLADFAAGGLLAAFGILAALHRRGKNGGRGCVLDCSMCEGVAYLGTFVSLYGNQQWMWDGEQFGAFTGKCPVYRTYQTSDGKWMAIGALEPKFQAELFKALNLLDVPVDAAELAEKLEQIFLTKSQAEWTQLFRDKDACVTPVLELDEKLGQFEQHKARGTFQQQKMESGHLCWVPRAMPIEIVDVNVKFKSKL